MLKGLKHSTDRHLNKILKMMQKQNENINKEIETIKNQREILELKNALSNFKLH